MPVLDRDFDYNQYIEKLLELLDEEKAGGRQVNGLEEIGERRERHQEIQQIFSQVSEQIDILKTKVQDLPILPSQELIEWAQSMKVMESLRLLEVDTTGTGSDAEMVRVTIADRQGRVVYDQFIKPASAVMSQEASIRSGITDAKLKDAPALAEVWERIRRELSGCYIVSFNYEWDVKVLRAAAEWHHLAAPVMVGECLQRRATAYYHREYYLDLKMVAARMGFPLESYDAPARLQAQHAILNGMSQGITNISQPEPAEPSPQDLAQSSAANGTSDGLGDLDDHPF